jgi:hypothetical protein
MHSVPVPDAFRDLRHALVRRRIERLDLRLRIELAVLVLVLEMFLFWQFRLRYAARASAGGAPAVALDLGAVLIALAVLGGFAVYTRHRRRLRGDVSGPAWLDLPLSSPRLAGHLAWESRLQILWVVPFALPAVFAGVGLVPPGWMLLLSAAFVALLLEAGHLGSALAWRLAVRAAPPSDAAPMTRLLAAGTAPARAVSRGSTPWRARDPVRALWEKDARACRRSAALASRLTIPVGLASASVAAWWLPHAISPWVVAYGLGLMAAATLGEFVIALAATDPFPVLRTLPVAVRDVWAARAAYAIGLAVVLGVAHAWFARGMELGARALFVSTLTLTTAAIGMLAVHYAVTLFPHPQHAQRLYTLALGLALTGSLLFPLVGWVLLGGALVHSARRLSRWDEIEEQA